MDEARESPLDEEYKSSALGSAFQENAAQLYRYIFSKVGNAPLAEDLTSQVFLKAMRWLQQDRSPASVRGWLYATARTTIVDYWREQARLETIPLDDLEIALFRGPDPEEEARRTREHAARVLCKLPEREREVLTLRYLRGYSAAEIGRVLGLPAGSVRMAQLRALRHAADPRASYVLLHAHDDGYSVQFRRVPYDYEAAIAARRSRHPAALSIAEHLRGWEDRSYAAS